MSMYQIEDFIESAVRTIAMSGLDKQEKRNLIYTLFEMEEHGDCGFTNLRTISEMVECSYSFAFDAKDMYDYTENPDRYNLEQYCYSEGDVYYDPQTDKFCVDSGSRAWEEMVKIGAIAGEGANPVDLLPYIEVLKQLKLLMGTMDRYTLEGYQTLMLLTGAFDEMTDEDCQAVFGTDKEGAEELLEADDEPLISENVDDRTKACLILGHACKFTPEVITSANGDVLLKGFNSEVCVLGILNTKIPFTATIQPNFDYTILSSGAKQMFGTDGEVDDIAMNMSISQFCDAFPLDSFVGEINHALLFTKDPSFMDTFMSHYMAVRNISADTQIEISRMWCEYTISQTGSLCDIYIQIKAENDAFSFDLRLRSGCDITREEYGAKK